MKNKLIILISGICIIIAAVTLIIGIGALFAVKPVKNQTDNNTQENGSSDTVDTPVSTQSTHDAESAVLPESKDMGIGYIDKIIFVGDSTTYHLINRAVLSGGKNTKQVWGGKTGYLNLNSTIAEALIVYPDNGEEMTIATAAALKKPEYMVITLGIDMGVAYLNDEDFAKYYQRLLTSVKEASPETVVMLQSIFPVTAEYQKQYPNMSNANIDKKNNVIKQLAADNGLGYLATSSVLKDENNCLKSGYDNGDGIHITVDAYEAMLKYIRTHAPVK